MQFRTKYLWVHSRGASSCNTNLKKSPFYMRLLYVGASGGVQATHPNASPPFNSSAANTTPPQLSASLSEGTPTSPPVGPTSHPSPHDITNNKPPKRPSSQDASDPSHTRVNSVSIIHTNGSIPGSTLQQQQQPLKADPRKFLSRSRSARSVLPEPRFKVSTSSSGFQTFGAIMESEPAAPLKFSAVDMVIEVSSAGVY